MTVGGIVNLKWDSWHCEEAAVETLHSTTIIKQILIISDDSTLVRLAAAVASVSELGDKWTVIPLMKSIRCEKIVDVHRFRNTHKRAPTANIINSDATMPPGRYVRSKIMSTPNRIYIRHRAFRHTGRV